jgi:hypothetical protein
VTFLGAMVGVTELVARYRDRPEAAIQSNPGLLYIAINAALALILLWLIRSSQLRLPSVPATGASLGATLTQVLTAGIGGMALLRTSIFTLRVKDTDIAIGPAALLQVVLSAADRACDRLRAGPRADRVKQIMRGVSFARARLALSMHCLALMQNITADERLALMQAISALAADKDLGDEVKSYILGLMLMTYVGEDVLAQAVSALDTIIMGPPPDDPPIFAQADSLAPADMPVLIVICAALEPLDRSQSVASQSPDWLAEDPELTRDHDKVVVILAKLRRFFGPDTLARAIALLLVGKKPAIRSAEPVTEAEVG